MREHFPGINAIGWVEPVAEGDAADFISPAIVPTPPGSTFTRRLAAALTSNREALGLNIVQDQLDRAARRRRAHMRD